MSTRRSRSSPSDDAERPGARSAGSNSRVRRVKFSAYRPISQPKRVSFGMRAARSVTGTRDMPRCYRSEEHTSELQSLMRISYAVFCLKKKNDNNPTTQNTQTTNTSSQKHKHIIKLISRYK